MELSSEYDIYTEDGDLVLVQDEDQVAQYVEIRLLSYLGEWFLNTDLGTPYFQSILGRVFRPAEAAAILRRRILATEGVDKIVSFDFNLTNRALSVSADIQINDTTATVTINETL